MNTVIIPEHTEATPNENLNLKQLKSLPCPPGALSYLSLLNQGKFHPLPNEIRPVFTLWGHIAGLEQE